jgi:hypothetical protein
MKKVANTGGNAGSREGKSGPWAVISLALVAACPAAWAQDVKETPPDVVVLAEARTEQQPVRVQVQTSALPRLEAQDSGFQAPRVDLSLFPAKANGMGAVLGVSGFSAQSAPGLGLSPMRPSIDLGLRFSHKQIDVTAWRRMNTSTDDAYTQIQLRQPVYGARVEMNLKPAKLNVLGIDRGFLGLQLESGARISIKRKDGRPMVYYRTTF